MWNRRLQMFLYYMVSAGLLLGILGYLWWTPPDVDNAPAVPGNPFFYLEEKLLPLATKKRKASGSDWLAVHPQPHQFFNSYVQQQPVRPSETQKTIYICLVGDFNPQQKKVLEITQEYLGIYFHAPVKVLKTMAVSEIPAKAKRIHPADGHEQFLTQWFLYDGLKQDQPADALAYIAFTTTDLWARDEVRDWNYLFGQGDLKNRLGVWSMARFGNPADSEAAFQQSLKLTLGIASHETGHILGLLHCVRNECNMNGCNHLQEAILAPLPLCPYCLRKLCWNLGVEPKEYVESLLSFSKKYQRAEEVKWYESVLKRLAE